MISPWMSLKETLVDDEEVFVPSVRVESTWAIVAYWVVLLWAALAQIAFPWASLFSRDATGVSDQHVVSRP